MRAVAPLAAALALGLRAASVASAADYHVGPGQAYGAIGAVPWFKLRPGDTVYIHHRPEPYQEKFLVSSRGTPERWIRVLGVPGPAGELPVVSGDGATTSGNMHHRWPDASGDRAIQQSGIVQIAYRRGDAAPKPGYIEIANLRVQDAWSAYGFVAENGASARYGDFAACIYARSAEHILIRDNVLTNCGLGFYDWTGSSPQELQVDTVLRGNHFHGNGIAGQYAQHASYTESDRVIIEHNRFGPMRAGALGSQIKDRSAGTVVRYNHVEQASGWMLDLVEPENGGPSLTGRPYYSQTFVYGNVLLSTGRGGSANVVHWNGDHGPGGRADSGGKLFFYGNTFVLVRDEPELWKFSLFHVHQGGFSCPDAVPGVIDLRNNLFVNLPRTAGARPAEMSLAGCGVENFEVGANWISPGWTYAFSHGPRYRGSARGVSAIVSRPADGPGFVDLGRHDLRLVRGSSAAGRGGPLAPEVTHNALGADLTPSLQYAEHRRVVPRAAAGAGSDLGALEATREPGPGAR